MKIISFFVLTIFLTASCHKTAFDFAAESERAENIYNASDIALAKKTLESFISQSETNEKEARKTKDVNYDWIIAMACLQLASIYKANGDQDSSDIYMNKAIMYFDRDPQVASDPNYLKDKRAALIDTLNKLENYKKPKWKS
jgi:hypothetical protein